MAKPALIAKITAADGKRDEVLEAFGPMMAHVRENEPGTLIYGCHTDDEDPNVVWFYELYTDDDAVAAHSGSDAMKNVGRSLKGLLAGPPEVRKLTPQAAKGIDL